MLLFKTYHVEPILSGKKTQTRRAWKNPRAKVGSVHLAKTEMLAGTHFAKVKILRVWKERLGDISPEDAQAEGGYTQRQFAEIFEAINGSYDPDLEITAVEFEVVEASASGGA